MPGAAKEAGCVAAAGDYVFTGGWKARGRISINRLNDGAEVGTFDPGPAVGGVENTGWIDILTGITAHRRNDGEYLVFVEEDYKAKVLLYIDGSHDNHCLPGELSAWTSSGNH